MNAKQEKRPAPPPLPAPDWAAYRLREQFDLYTLACLLHRTDPQGLFDEVWNHLTADDGGPWCSPEARQSIPAAIFAAPSMFLGEPVGPTLGRMKTAMATGNNVLVKLARAQELATALGLAWPMELDNPAKTNAAPQPPKRKRADLLTPVIERAQAQANDPTNHGEVFAILRTWATSNDKPAPIVDYVSGAGVKWRDGSDDMRWLNLEALRKRLNPRPPRSAAKRR